MRYRSIWLEIAREQYNALGEPEQEQVRARVEQLVERPELPPSAYDPASDQWITTYGTPERYRERYVALRVMSVVWREPAPVFAALMRTGVLEQAEEAYGSLSRVRKISALGRQLLNDLRGVGIDSPEPGPERARSVMNRRGRGLG